MKKALALIGTIIFVFSIVPMGVFATDGDYSDHTSNLAPYVDAIIRGFTDSNNMVRHTLHIDDIELWQDGLPLGQYQLTASVPADCDVIDIDFYFDSGDLMTDQYYQLFDIYITGLVNIDYIEFYQHTNYRSFPIYYATYHQNRLYVMTASNVLQSGGYTMRVHIKRGGFTVAYYSDILPYVYLRELTDLTTTETLTEWYYLTSLLRELDTLEINVSNLSIDLTNVNASLSLIESIMRTNNYGNNYFLGDSPNKDKCGVFTIPNVGIYEGTMHTNYLSKFTNSGSGKGLANSVVMLQFPIIYPSNFLQINIPLVVAPVYRPGVTYDVRYCVAPLAETTSAFNTYIDNGTISFDKEYSSILNYKFTGDKWILYIPIPTLTFPITSGAIYIYFHCEGYTSNAFTIKDDWTSDTTGIYCWGANHAGTKGSILTMDIMMRQLLFALQGLQASSGGAVTYPDYPSGPSDPQDPNQTTNIYDVNIEFNTQVGDISVFENTYSQQLPTYDQSISDQYLIPVSNSYDFSDLNSTFNSIWQSSFQYDTDEEDNIVGVYGIGLYFIIPLVLLVLFALFRRVTS